jgi:ketopantoate reductase
VGIDGSANVLFSQNGFDWTQIAVAPAGTHLQHYRATTPLSAQEKSYLRVKVWRD